VNGVVRSVVTVLVLLVGLAGLAGASPAPCTNDQISVDTSDTIDSPDYALTHDAELTIAVERSLLDLGHELLPVTPRAHRVLDSAPKTSPPRAA
jgi:hypothetical protein